MSYGEDMIKAIMDVKERAEAGLPAIRSEIADMIEKKETSTKRIEHLLDTLLDFTRIGMGDREFQQLNDYYAQVNREKAKQYAGFYQDVLAS